MARVLITNINSIWTHEFIKNILFEKDIKIYITAFEEVEKKTFDILKDYNIEIIDLYKESKIKKTFKLIFKLFKINKQKKIKDVTINWMPSSFLAYVVTFVVYFFGEKTVGSFIGSDLLTKEYKEVKKLKLCLKKLDYIVLGSSRLVDKFHEYFGNKYDSKIRTCIYGSPIFDEIKDIENISRISLKEEFKLNSKKKIISIGYNGFREQQHLELIDSLKGLKSEVKEKVFILVHLAYSLESEEYKKEIKEKLNSINIEFKIINKMFSKKETAKLRRLVDIALQGQVSDALSSSIREYLYAGAILINPSWLNYKEFKKLNISYLEYDKFEEIEKLITDIIENNLNIEKKANKEKLYNNFSWKAAKGCWKELYK